MIILDFSIAPKHLASHLLIPVCRPLGRFQCFLMFLAVVEIGVCRASLVDLLNSDRYHILSLDALIGVSDASDGGIVIPLPSSLE